MFSILFTISFLVISNSAIFILSIVTKLIFWKEFIRVLLFKIALLLIISELSKKSIFSNLPFIVSLFIVFKSSIRFDVLDKKLSDKIFIVSLLLNEVLFSNIFEQSYIDISFKHNSIEFK